MSQKISVGRIVHYKLPLRHDGDPGQWRPAMVTSVHGDGDLANLTVFLDACNDVRQIDEESFAQLGIEVLDDAHASVGSAEEGDKQGNWRWPPRA